MRHWTEFLEPEGADGAYLPWKKVEPRVGISRTTAWRLQRSGDFPKPYVVSPGRVAYRESEVEAWKASRGHRQADHQRRTLPLLDPAEPPALLQETPSWSPAPLPLEPASSTGPPTAPAALEAASRPPKRPRKPAPSNQMRFEF